MKRERLRPFVPPSPLSVGRMVGGCRANGREQTSSALSLFGARLKGNNSFVRLSPMWLLLLLPLSSFWRRPFRPSLAAALLSIPLASPVRPREEREAAKELSTFEAADKVLRGRGGGAPTDGREPNFFSQLSPPFSPLPFLPPLPPPKAQRKRGENQSRSERRRGSNDPQYMEGRGARKRSFGCCCCCSRCRCMRPLLLQPPPPLWGLMR